MLHAFLTVHRAELIERCRVKAQRRSATTGNPAHGVPHFLDQLIRTLEVEATSEPLLSRKVSGPSGGGERSEIGASATLHGRELELHGLSIDQVIHAYGDVCQAITDLALEHSEPIRVEEFRTLNRCLDNGLAEAVTEFASQHDAQMASRDALAFNERLGALAHELRNFIQTATLALSAIRAGSVGLTGATSAVLDRSLIGMRNLVDRSLADVRVTAGVPLRYQLIALADFVSEMKISASLEAAASECKFTIAEIDEGLVVNADRDLLFSAVGNLLQNAFKFTAPGSEVRLAVYAVNDRVRIEVEDHCGGLERGAEQTMFLPFTQNHNGGSGVGLGLSICRRSVEANNGTLSVCDVPRSGCVFTINLPRHYVDRR